jgi:hypothetical protein
MTSACSRFNAGQGATTLGSVQARTLYALRRVVRSKRALFQPHLHPEVATVQMQLVQQLIPAARQCAKGTHTQKVGLDSGSKVINEHAP